MMSSRSRKNVSAAQSEPDKLPMLSYINILFVLPSAMPDDEFAMFHARQGIMTCV